MLLFSPFGYALRALRDNEARAGAIGLARAAAAMGRLCDRRRLCGARRRALRLSQRQRISPTISASRLSVDGLAMTLIGGVEAISGGVVGAIVFRTFSIWTVSHTDYSRLVIGALIVALVVVFPKGIVGAIVTLGARAGLRR